MKRICITVYDQEGPWKNILKKIQIFVSEGLWKPFLENIRKKIRSMHPRVFEKFSWELRIILQKVLKIIIKKTIQNIKKNHIIAQKVFKKYFLKKRFIYAKVLENIFLSRPHRASKNIF